LEFGGNDEVLLATGTAVVTPNQSGLGPTTTTGTGTEATNLFGRS
jgi:hypothetical protein